MASGRRRVGHDNNHDILASSRVIIPAVEETSCRITAAAAHYVGLQKSGPNKVHVGLEVIVFDDDVLAALIRQLHVGSKVGTGEGVRHRRENGRRRRGKQTAEAFRCAGKDRASFDRLRMP
jgi:hypothetical protein